MRLVLFVLTFSPLIVSGQSILGEWRTSELWLDRWGNNVFDTIFSIDQLTFSKVIGNETDGFDGTVFYFGKDHGFKGCVNFSEAISVVEDSTILMDVVELGCSSEKYEHVNWRQKSKEQKLKLRFEQKGKKTRTLILKIILLSEEQLILRKE